MKILVLVSNVPDTTTKVKFVDGNKSFDTTGVQWIINPWDELALTRALELKESSNGVIEKVSVISVGAKSVEPTLRKALAIGADDAIRVDVDAQDAYSVAGNIAEAIRDENFDLILAGIESSDYNNSAVGGMLSEFLGLPSISSVTSIEMAEDGFSVKREIEGGTELLAIAKPFVAIVQKGIAINPRIPSMRGIMMARKKPLAIKEATAIEAMTEFDHFELPEAKGKVKLIDAENAKELIRLLHEEAKVI
jgi:electron transfer flavoprotein beta subunit